MTDQPTIPRGRLVRWFYGEHGGKMHPAKTPPRFTHRAPQHEGGEECSCLEIQLRQ
jgi:hypothetical protein